MRGCHRISSILLWAIVFASVCMLFALDGRLAPAEAFDRWVGNVTLLNAGVILDFIVLVDPGKSASFEWRSRGVVIFSEPLAADVAGSKVSGTLYPAGGTATNDPSCCIPCRFTGTISGNRVDGALDPATCTDNGQLDPLFLIKQ